MFEKIAGIIGCRKLSADILWNIGALAVTGISGLILNIMIAAFYGEEPLGVFNQCYAFYIIFAQFGSMGIHYSVLKHIPEDPHNSLRVKNIATSGLVLTCCFSLLAACILYFGSNLAGKMLDSDATGIGIRLAILGVLLLPVNKLMAAVFNGMRYMKIFAVLQTSRAVFWLGSILIFVFENKEGNDLPLVLSVGEAGVFLLTAILYIIKIGIGFTGIKTWLGKHFSFGIRGMLTGVLTDLNTRVDVLMLGIFLDDKQVGIYSLAAILAEGALQLLVVIRNNFNPLISSFLHEQKYGDLHKLVVSSRKWVYPFVFICSAVAVTGFYFCANIYDANGFAASVPCFTILMLGVVLCSGYFPFTMIFIQSGRPVMQSRITYSLLLFNAFFNALFIPFWGIEGAAVATSMSFVFFVIINIVLCRKYIHTGIL